jgi:hypothetical protein
MLERPPAHDPAARLAQGVADRLGLGPVRATERRECVVQVATVAGFLDRLSHGALDTLELLVPCGEQRPQLVEVLVGAIADPPLHRR